MTGAIGRPATRATIVPGPAPQVHSPRTVRSGSMVAIYRATLFKPSETFIHHQAAALQQHEPELVGLRSASAIQGELPVRVTRPDPRTTVALLAGRPPATLLEAIETIDPALVHAHFGPDGSQVLPVARRLGLPLVVTLHGHDILVRPTRALSLQRLAYLARRSRLLDGADLVLCVSDFLHRAALDLGAPPDRLVRHRIGIALDDLLALPSVEPGRRETICFVGRLTAKKGIADVARVVRGLRRRGLANPVDIIGDGPLAPIVESLVRDEPDVTWHGARPHEAVLDLFGRSLLAIQPSQTGPDGDAESLGLVFPEAMARGCIPVGYRHGGVGEVMPDGLLCDEGDVEALTDIAETIIRSPAAAADQLGLGLATIREHFDLSTQTAILEELYRDLAG